MIWRATSLGARVLAFCLLVTPLNGRADAGDAGGPAFDSDSIAPLPPVRHVVRLALQAARARGPVSARELVRRARLSGLAPELRLAAERGQQQDLSLSDSGSTARTREAQGDALKLQATLTFDFARLVFAPEEVRLLSVERWLAGDAQQLVEQVVRLYFKLQRARRALASGEEPEPEVRQLEAAEAFAMLDILTDGALSGPAPR
jgi:hypothetical protein